LQGSFHDRSSRPPHPAASSDKIAAGKSGQAQKVA
jgi:hypothetical protein